LPAWERYLQEQADEGMSWQMLNGSLRDQVRKYWLPIRPDAMRHTLLVLGNFLSSPPMTFDVQPTVDFKVWMDMQYNLIATDPLFFGLAGLMDWTSGYADEENIRWTAKLFRHYAIEGRTDMLSPQYGFRFRLSHIENPDFDTGLNGWEVTAAATGSVDTRTFNGYSSLQGRYPETAQGNTFLRMQRCANAPNTVAQTIRNLVPGKLYSLKLMSSDYGDLLAGRSDARKVGPSIELGNVDLMTTKSVTGLSATKWCTTVPAFNASHPYWITYHYRVFRARTAAAHLALSDWLSATEPGGPPGQELACNFVEVQPYLAELP
jgi:hypothetical protein